MKEQLAIPHEYKPYNKVFIGSNSLEKCKFLIGYKEYSPILIGKGDHGPRIWLYLYDQFNERWWPVVVDNKSIGTSKVSVIAKEGKVLLTTHQTTIIKAEEINKDEIEILKLDLKPIGLDVTADKEKLLVGGSRLTKNYFENSKYAIGLS